MRSRRATAAPRRGWRSCSSGLPAAPSAVPACPRCGRWSRSTPQPSRPREMSITAYLKEIGRGKDGARALDAAQAEDLMRQIFEGHVSDLQLGAFVIAMRIKGESPAELAGFLAAAQAHMCPTIAAAVRRSTRPIVWLPSYNGARKLPNFTPLLA